MLLMIDNYDSFTYNLVQYLGELGAEVRVVRNDELSIRELAQLQPEQLVVSPGPCNPDKAGISMAAIEHFAGQIPILGVCLGHQCIAQVFGGQIVHAGEVMHGKTSLVCHRGEGVFQDLQQPMEATRYHSLVADVQSLPDCLEVTAWTETEQGEFDEIMAVSHKTYPIQGVQFHPESILTKAGHDLLRNFLQQAG